MLPVTWRSRSCVVALGLIILPIALAGGAELGDNLPPEAIAPKLESLDKPNKKYRTGEIIAYQIRVQWPETTNEVRMNPPDLTLENLELVGVGQETISKPEHQDLPVGEEQILTYRFIAPKPGRAAIKRFSLRWTQGEGISTNELAIPPLELTITPPPKPWLRIMAISAGLGGGLGFILWLFLIWKSKKNIAVPIPVKSLEEGILDQLQEIQTAWESKAKHQEFLSDLAHILRRYSSQKLDWNPSQEDYNALQKKAEEKWSKKDAFELAKLFQALEQERFADTQLERGKLTRLYQTIYSFVERRRVI